MEKITRYRCASCGADWTRSRARGSKAVPCPSGCAAEHRREVHYCEPGEHDFERVPARGTPPKRCAEHGGGNRGRGLERVKCSVCGAACLKNRTQVSAARRGVRRMACSPGCRTALRVGLGYYPSRADFEAATRVPTPPKPIGGLRRIRAERDRPALEEYLLARSRVTSDGCWEWVQRVDRRGYPRLAGEAAHRIAYEVVHGTPPTGDHVHHACGRSTCVNPEHLRLSTARENIGEMLARRAYEARLREADEIYLAILADETISESLRERARRALSPSRRP